MTINKEHKAYPALLMGIVALVVCSLLMLTSELTKEPIAQRKYEDLNRQLAKVLPAESYDNEPLAKKYIHNFNGKKWSFYRASFEGLTSAVILFNKSAGYSGDISLLIAIKADGSLSGVRVLSHSETPGLGDLIEESKSDWILSFNNLSLEQPQLSGWAVKKDGGQFDAFTGATITPRAVIKGVVEALELFKKERDFFLNSPEKPISQSDTPLATKGKANDQ